MPLKCSLSMVFLAARIADWATTHVILNSFPDANEANPLAALVLESWGYSGMFLLMLCTSLFGLAVMWYAWEKRPRAGRVGLVAICAVSVAIVLHNIAILTYCHLYF